LAGIFQQDLAGTLLVLTSPPTSERMSVSPKSFFWTNEMDKYQRYEAEKSTWLYLHPDATPHQIQDALKAIAKRLGV
jgi:hypothetical protein